MGNICGKESDAFAQPGRRLGVAPETPATVAVPASATAKAPKVGGPPRRLGGDNSNSSGGTPGSSPEEARRKAALAAEVSLTPLGLKCHYRGRACEAS